ncbi:hypothetical protein Tsubulata_033682 [Turnera subulata]|uniref:Peptidase S8/S53 domain-containing protein n=1 Tax=Turnera subulata TaxID=218843 RepID=A0A9Q0JMF7_9ROSI|nr:hypothetical protein Tsubulata_033682 [Turnera subulata]
MDKGHQAALAGAVGMILANDEADGNKVVADLHVLPASHVNYKDGLALYAYINSTKIPYIPLQGTSMSCPHVSGVAGLLKTLHPDWSPAAIRSAIMTTARTRGNTANPMQTESSTKATPFNYGAGHIRPNRAQDPGLVYDLNSNDYLGFLSMTDPQCSYRPYECPESVSLLNFNYPSIAVPRLAHAITLTRKLKNVGEPGRYAARVTEPYGISVIVDPKVLVFDKIGDESFTVTLEAKWPGAAKDYEFGHLIWADGKGHYVRSPIAVATAAAAPLK